MIGSTLFRRFFLRFLIGLGLAFLLFVPLVNVFQRRIVDGERREDLQQEAGWAARHIRPVWKEEADPKTGQMYANAWRTMHSTTRVTF